MKRYALIAIGFLLATGTAAQPFGAHNAQWHFNLTNWWPLYAIVPVEVNGSSPLVVGADTCHWIIINGPTGCALNDSMLITQRNDSVLHFHEGHNSFELLYHYNAMIGDTHTLFFQSPLGPDTSIQMVVTDTGSITINGQWKRTYTTAPLTYYYSFGGLIIEDIGCIGFIFPQFGFCDPLVGGIRCYSDTVTGLYQFQPWTDCDTILYSGISSAPDPTEIAALPNPGYGVYHIKINDPSCIDSEYRIINSSGQIIECGFLNRDAILSGLEIDITGNANGIYSFVLTSGSRCQTVNLIKL